MRVVGKFSFRNPNKPPFYKANRHSITMLLARLANHTTKTAVLRFEKPETDYAKIIPSLSIASSQ